MQMDQRIKDAYAASKNYPELIVRLIALGIHSYSVEVSSGSALYRLADGVTLLHDGSALRIIAENFNKSAAIQAVRDSQADKITYAQFMEAIAKSGVRLYEATLIGPNKRVNYIGRSDK